MSLLAGGARVIDERELIRLSRQGDQGAFAQLVVLKREKAFRIALNVVGDEGDAQDIAQQAFIKLWSALPQFDEAQRFDPWFFTIVLNLAIDHTRKRRRSPLVLVEEPSEPGEGAAREPFDAAAPGADAAMMRAELRRVFNRIAAELAPVQRAVFTLREIEGFATEEVARMMKIKASTVRNHLHQARRVLQEALRRRFPEYFRRKQG